MIIVDHKCLLLFLINDFSETQLAINWILRPSILLGGVMLHYMGHGGPVCQRGGPLSRTRAHPVLHRVTPLQFFASGGECQGGEAYGAGWELT